MESSDKPVALISSSESQSVQDILSTAFTLRHVAGAGYKLLGVCKSRAEAYVLTKSSNFKWDSCGPHAVLRSMGGGIIKYEDLYSYVQHGQEDFGSIPQIKYHEPDNKEASGASKWCNIGGVVAYRDVTTLKKIAQVLKKTAV